MFALRLISVLVYVDIELSAFLVIVLEGAGLSRLP
jgi:hypothetical protein